MKAWIGGDTPLRAVVTVTVTGAVTVALLAVLGVGSWYADDLDFLVHGTEGFSVQALLTPVNDHVAPGLRFAYAVMALGGLPPHGLTIVGRVLLWAIAVLLTAGLARRIVDRPGPPRRRPRSTASPSSRCPPRPRCPAPSTICPHRCWYSSPCTPPWIGSPAGMGGAWSS